MLVKKLIYLLMESLPALLELCSLPFSMPIRNQLAHFWFNTNCCTKPAWEGGGICSTFPTRLQLSTIEKAQPSQWADYK